MEERRAPTRNSSVCAENQKKKKKYSDDEDRISELPDEILISVLSRLTMKDVTRTSVLSHRWEKLWTLLPLLNFDVSDSYYKCKLPYNTAKDFVHAQRPKFSKWVNNVLDLYEGVGSSSIDEFIVRYDLDRGSSYDLDNWVYFALRKKVKKLELNLLDFVGMQQYNPYFFPLCSDPTRTWLLKRKCGILSCNSLTSLQLNSVNVGGEVLEYFLGNCPFLERLSVAYSNTLVNLRVEGPSLCLKYLEIERCNHVKSLVISATNLVSFKYGGSHVSAPFRNVPKLVEVSVDMGFESSVSLCKVFPPSSCFLQLQTLSLYVKRNEGSVEFLEFPIMHRLKLLELIVKTSDDSQSLLGFRSLIKAAPSLHKFSLKLQWWHDLEVVRELQSPPESLHQCLKVVEFTGFVGKIIDIELLLYLLENCIMLEKVIIDPRWEGRTSALLQSARNSAETLKGENDFDSGFEIVIL